jgi:hypothetical protein
VLEAILDSSSGGWSLADVARWVAFLAGALYLVELLWTEGRRLRTFGRLLRRFRPARAPRRTRFLNRSRLLFLLALLAAVGIALVAEFVTEPKRAYWVIALVVVIIGVGGAQAWDQWKTEREPPLINTAEALEIFEAETRGGFQMTRLHDGTLGPSDPWLLRMPDMRVTNQQNNSKLSIDLQVRLPDGSTWNNMPIRAVRSLEEVPQHLRPAKPLVAPFSVEPGDTVEGDALFILPNSVHLDQLMASGAPAPGSRLLASASYSPPGGVSDLGVEEFHPILRVIDYVSNFYAELEVSERAPALDRHEAQE